MSVIYDNFPSLPAAFFEIASQQPERIVYRQAIIDESDSPERVRPWYSRKYSEVRERVVKLAHFLRSVGVVPGDKVAIVSSSRPEWMEADLAILCVGAVSVSVYQSLPYDDVGYILFDSDSKVVFAENQEQIDKLTRLMAAPVTIPATEERSETQAQIGLKRIICFEEASEHPLVSQFQDIVAGSAAGEIDTFRSLKPDDLAALVYTSGTTGPPKGVMQTHRNHLSNVRQAVHSGLTNDESAILVFLPLAHAFAKLMGYIGFLTPAHLCFAGIGDKKSSVLRPDSVTKDIREAGATIVPVVPRLLEKMQSGIQEKARGSGIAGRLLGLTLRSAHEVYEARTHRRSPGMLAMIAFQGTAPLRKKIRKQLFGENFIYSISGGAKLNPETARFFDALEIEILEGYGLTETCVATNVNRLGSKKIGSVGPVLADDIELLITDDGEICFRGPNIAKGYYNRDSATRASWDKDGWFHTGDLGELDEKNFLAIVGRKKDIIVTSYGKNVAPEDIEAKMKSSQYISQVVLVGDGKPFCAALVSIDPVAVGAWAKKLGYGGDSRELVELPQVKDLIWKEVEKVNADLANYESVKKIALVPEDFTVENGMLTPTFKVKRKVAMEVYQKQIDGMYSAE
ncbi:MAG: long-chain fatty acid--CoA ligase [Bdellovibrionales bacterium]|nr:long-chain fatty acid--CoA ligase [Bdellovibrionales bacterium]